MRVCSGPFEGCLGRLQNLGLADVCDSEDDMRAQDFRLEHLEAAQQLNVLELGVCYPHTNTPDEAYWFVPDSMCPVWLAGWLAGWIDWYLVSC